MLFPMGFFDFFEYHNLSRFNKCATAHVFSEKTPFKVSQAVFWSVPFYYFF